MPGSSLSKASRQAKKNYFSRDSYRIGNRSDVYEEMRNHVLQLKSELDMEKAKTKQIHREKVSEIRKMRDDLEFNNSLNLESATIKMKVIKENEIKRIRESLNRDKDLEIKQIIKFKDEEIKTLQRNMQEEKEIIVKEMEEKFRKQLSVQMRKTSDDLEITKLKQEISELRQLKEECDETSKKHLHGLNVKNEMIKQMKSEHEKEMQKLLREARCENSRSYSELQQVKKSLQEKSNELTKLGLHASRMEEEKDRLTLKAKLDYSPVLNSTTQYVELNSTAISEKRVKDLKCRNTELVSIAKKLEERAKQTQMELNELKSQNRGYLNVSTSALNVSRNESMSSLKKSFAIQRAKDLAEHARVALLKDKQLEEQRKKNISSQEEHKKDEDIRAALQHAEKERLRLERQLVLSPSTNSPTLIQVQTELDRLVKTNSVTVEELKELQEIHSICYGKEDKLNEKYLQLETLTEHLQEKEEECTALSTSLMKKESEMTYLQKEMKEKQLQCCMLIKHTEIHKSNIKGLEENILELKKQLKSMEKLKNERNDLKTKLFEADNRCSIMQQELTDLNGQIKTLKQETSLNQRKLLILQAENCEAVKKLVARDNEIAELHQAQEQFKLLYSETVSTLEDDLRDIEAKCKTIGNEKEELLKQLDRKLNIDSKESQTHIVEYKDVAIQTDFDNLAAKGYSKGQNSLIDSVFTPGENKMRSILAISKIDSSKISIASQESVDTEDCSIKSEDILELASVRIDQLAVSVSEGESLLEPKENIMTRLTFADTDDELSIEEIKMDPLQNENEMFLTNSLSPPIDKDEKSTTMDKGTFSLFLAKYSYDPSLYSPNGDHELELPLQAGEKVYVYGGMGEDGFYLAELQSGKHGFVPSNLIERMDDQLCDLTDDDLTEVTMTIPSFRSIGEESIDVPLAAEYLQHSGTSTLDESNDFAPTYLIQENSFALESETEDEQITPLEKLVPAPRNLKIDRQLNNSVVLAWNTPLELQDREINGYSICVNGVQKQTVLGSTRTKALVSDIDSTQVYRLSVRTIKMNNEQSVDEQAVISFGKGAVPAPYNLSVSNVTTISAEINWKPSNSSYSHAVYINHKECSLIQAGKYKCLLQNLMPSTHYIIDVQSRIWLHKPSSQAWSSTIELQTLEGISPKPPFNVTHKLEDNFVHISWIPVTINNQGTSNGSIVTGYKVYVENKEIAEVTSPTADAVQLLWKQIHGVYSTVNKELQMFVRTQSTSGESCNSNSTLLQTRNCLLVNEDIVVSSENTESQPVLDFDNINEENVNNTLTNEVNVQSEDSDSDSNGDDGENKYHIWREFGFGDMDDITNIEKPPTHYNPENDPLFLELESSNERIIVDEDRIVISDEELSVIEEESEAQLLSYEKKRARTKSSEQSKSIEISPSETNAIHSDHFKFPEKMTDDTLESLQTFDIASEDKVSNPNKPGVIQQKSIKENIVGSAEMNIIDRNNILEEIVKDDKIDLDIQGNNIREEEIMKGDQTDISENVREQVNKILKISSDLLNDDTKIKTDDSEISVSSSMNLLSSNTSDIILNSDALTVPDSPSELTESLSDSIDNSIMSFKQEIKVQYNLQDLNDTDNDSEHSDESASKNLSADSSLIKGNLKTYNIEPDKEQSIDLNHNETYSINSGKENIKNNYISLSMNSTGIIEMIEKDEHRDIIDDFPELPLDNQIDHTNEDTVRKQQIQIDQANDDKIRKQQVNKIESVSDKSDNIRLTEDYSESSISEDSSEIDDDSIENDLQLSSLKLSSILTTTSESESKQTSNSINFSETDNEIELLLETKFLELKLDDEDGDNKDVRNITGNNKGIGPLYVVGQSITSKSIDELGGDATDEQLKPKEISNVAKEKGEKLLTNMNSISESISDNLNDNIINYPEILMVDEALSKSESTVSENVGTSLLLENKDLTELQHTESELFNPIILNADIEKSSSIDVQNSLSVTVNKDDDSEDNSMKISESVNNLYSFSYHHIDESSSEQSDIINDDDNDPFDYSLTPMNELGGNKFSYISAVSDEDIQNENKQETQEREESNELHQKKDITQDLSSQNHMSLPDLGESSNYLENINCKGNNTEYNRDDVNYNGNNTEYYGEDIKYKDKVPDKANLELKLDDRPEQLDEHECIRIFIALYPYNPLTMSPNVDYIEDELAFNEGALIKIYGEADEDGFYFGELNGKTGVIPGNMVSEIQVNDVDTALHQIAAENNDIKSINESDSFAISYMIDRNGAASSETLESRSSQHQTESSTASLTSKRLEFTKIDNTLSSKRNSVQYHREKTNDTEHAKSMSMPNLYQDDEKAIDVYQLPAKRMIALFDYDPSYSSPNVDSELISKFIIHVPFHKRRFTIDVNCK